MKRHQFPTFKAGQAGFSIALQCVQIFQQAVQIGGKCVRIFGISLGESRADVSGHYLSVFRGEPDVGVVLVVVIFMTVVVFFLRVQEGDTVGTIDDIRIVQNTVQKILQPCAGDHDDLGGLRRLYLTDVQGVVVQAGDAFRHQSGDGEGRIRADSGGKFIHGQGRSGNLCRLCLRPAAAEQHQQCQQNRK